MSLQLQIVCAFDDHYGIGWRNNLPWGRHRRDMTRFVQKTEGTILLMGRKTWESIPLSARSFPGRVAVEIVGSTPECTNPSVAHALRSCHQKHPGVPVSICGGEHIYREVLVHFRHLVTHLFLSCIPGEYQTDRSFPVEVFSAEPYLKRILDNPLSFCDVIDPDGYKTWDIRVGTRDLRPTPGPEDFYMRLLKEALRQPSVPSRAGTTRSLFSRHFELDLQDGFPLMTHKRVFWRGLAEETLFFLKGKSQTRELEEKGVMIWSGNTSEEFLRARGLPYEQGDMGPMYGPQWRRFGAPYPWKSCTGLEGEGTDLEGTDQIERLIQGLREDPYSRRHVVTAWNPADLDKMALAPCHGTFQMHVRTGYVKGTQEKKMFLDTLVFQRSSDLVLGLPFNIASYALITHIVAQMTDYAPGKLSFILGDAHIYETHLDAIQKILERPALRWPTLEIQGLSPGDRVEKLEDLCFEDLKLKDYVPFPSIKAPMSI